MKTGIVTDDYKLDKYKKELNAKGYYDITILPFTDEISTIQIDVTAEQIQEIKKICEEVELYFRMSIQHN